jgi:hypothetical protein
MDVCGMEEIGRVELRLRIPRSDAKITPLILAPSFGRSSFWTVFSHASMRTVNYI